MLRIYLIGRLAVDHDGSELPLPAGSRGRSLLAWLALNPGPHPRSRLAGRFWPDVLEASARTSLRGALLDIRRALGPAADVLTSTRDTAGLTDGVWVDALEFERLVGSGELEAALELGTGELAPGLDDDWLNDAREAHRARLSEVLETLAERAAEAGEHATAATLSRRLVTLEPLSEEAHRALIRRLAAAGDRAAAMTAYDVLRERLERELRIAPAAETRALIARLREEDDETGAAPTTGAWRLPLPPGRATDEDGLIGRTPELRRLEEIEAEVRAGQGRLVLLAGDAGMGKTRLASEFCRAVHARGATVLFGRCDEEAIAPYQPWVEALRHYVAIAPEEALRRGSGTTAPELARVLPAVSERLPDLGPPLRAEPDTERYRLFEAVSALLTHIAAESPALVVVLDDLHWADTPTLLMLRHVVRATETARVMILGTFRESELDGRHPLADALVALRREREVERIPIAGLDESEVGALVEQQRGHAADEPFVHALYEETEGNPFFVGEIVRNLPPDARPHEALAAGELPQGVRDAIERRLRRLSGAAREALTVAAVLGSEFDLALIEELQGRPGDEVLKALDEAVREQLLMEMEGTVGRYGFRHALIRATLYDEPSRTWRARLHLRAGEALERLSPQLPERPLGELAYHFCEAAAADPDRRAILYSTLAAERASSQLAYEEAAAHLRRALDAVQVAGADVDAARDELLLYLGQSEYLAGETLRAREAFARAADGARRSGNGERLARAALGLAGQAWQSFGEVDEQAIGLLREALDMLDHADSALRARTLARLASALYFTPDREQLVPLSSEALAMARRVGDAEALAAALDARLYALWHLDGAAERLDVATELLDLAERAGLDELAAQARRWRVVPLLELGRMADARAETDAHATAAATLGQPYEQMYTKVFRTMWALFEGAFADAQRLAGEILSSEHGRPGADALQFYGLDTFTLCFSAGGIEALEQPLRDFVEAYPGIPAWRTALVLIQAQTGRHDEARAGLRELAAGAMALFPRDANWPPAYAWLSLSCWLLDDAEVAAELYPLAVPYAERACVGGAGGAVWGSFSLYLGLLAATAGDAEAAERHLADEARWAHERGGRPWEAHALYAQGRVDEALEIAGPLGMRYLAGGEVRTEAV